MAPRIPLARGWERQLDRRFGALFYDGLNAATYRAWLDERAVAYVAVPDAALDDAGREEARLVAGVTVRADRAGLVRVHFTRWWRVTGGRGCVSEAPGAMTRVTLPAAGTIRLQARLPGASCRR